MLTFSHSHILRYRLVCLILAVGYFLYQFTEANYNNFGIQFRYLTIWGLTTAMIVTWLLYKSKRKGLPESYLPFVSAMYEFGINRLQSPYQATQSGST